MKLTVIILLMMMAQLAFAEKGSSEELEVEITKANLKCSKGLIITVPEIAPYVEGRHKNLTLRSGIRDLSCFFRNFLVDTAKRNGGQLTGKLEVSRDTITKPILKCTSSCAYCPDNCKVIGYKSHIEERVFLDIYGLRFFSTNKLE